MYVFVLALPLNLFLAIMGGGSPQSKGFLYSLAVVFGMELGALLKVVDSILSLSLTISTFSYLGLFVSSILFVVIGNVFVDNLYQFKQGNYGISITAIALLCGFWFFVVVIGRWSPFST